MSPTDRTGCSAPHHGTVHAYKHGCRCDDARRAFRGYKKRLQRGTQPSCYVPTQPSQRRIQALQAIGYARKHLAAELGYDCPSHASLQPVFWRPSIRSELADQITALYDRLSGTPGPSEIAQRRARRAGYRPPLDWDDIATGELAPPVTSGGTDQQVDEIAVVRAINGHPPAKLRRPDRLAAITRLAQSGMASTDIADRLRCGVDRVRTDRNTLDNQKRRGRREAC